MRRMIVAAVAAAALIGQAWNAQAAEGKPWRVFILAGQSNMGSRAHVSHLEQLLADAATAEPYKALRTDDGWIVRDDVWLGERNGTMKNLTVERIHGRFGPELGFGMVVGDALDEKVLLIVAGWGGRDLFADFRPPSSGTGDFAEEWINAHAQHRRVPPELALGLYYRAIVLVVSDMLLNLEERCPAYKGEGYEISGFVWHQGWNDYLNPKATEQYSENLSNLLRDLRKDLDVPNMPMIIGEMGAAGADESTWTGNTKTRTPLFRAQQRSVAEMTEFEGRAVYVPTGIYVSPEGPFFDGGHHYGGRADTIYQIGAAFGKAVLPLLDKAPVDQSERVGAACRQATEKYGEIRKNSSWLFR